MMMIPRVAQLSTPAAERVGEGVMPTEEDLAPMGRFNDELEKAGALVTVDGLHPLIKGARVAFAKGSATVTDGPFIETKEVIGGFWMIEVKSKQEAIDWARRCPAADGDVIEIRQVWEMSELFPNEQK